MLTYIRKRPNPSGPFKVIADWDNVLSSALDLEAQKLYEKRAVEGNLKKIHQNESKIDFFAFLRYDYKKILLRTRYLYLDRIFDQQSQQLKGDDLSFAFFEPILICFPTLEFLGRLTFSDEIEWTPERPNSKKILCQILQQMGDGYAQCAERLVDWHRHALSHELRPGGDWTYDLNTEDKYGPPKWINGSMIYLNIPHFIDSCLLEIENICDHLTEGGAANVMNKFSAYISRRFNGS